MPANQLTERQTPVQECCSATYDDGGRKRYDVGKPAREDVRQCGRTTWPHPATEREGNAREHGPAGLVGGVKERLEAGNVEGQRDSSKFAAHQDQHSLCCVAGAGVKCHIRTGKLGHTNEAAHLPC